MAKLKFTLVFALVFASVCVFGQQRQIDELKLELAGATTDSAKSVIYSDIAFYAISTDLEYSKKNVDLAIELAKKSNSKYAKALAYKNLGLYYMYLSNLDTSNFYLDSSLFFYKSINDTDGISRVYNNIGLNYLDDSQYLKSLEYMEKSLAICDANKDTTSSLITMNNIGIIYVNLNDLDKAKEMFERVVELSTKIGNDDMKASSYINLADLYYDDLDTIKAEFYIDEALRMAKEVGDSLTYYECFTSKAYYENKKGNYSNAFNYINNAIRFFDLNKIAINYSNALTIKSEIHLNLNQLDIAEKLALKAYYISDSVNYINYIYNTALTLRDIYLLKKDYKNAYKYLDRINSLQDTINTQLNVKQLAQKEYELNLKQAQSQFDIEAEKQKLQYENQLNKERIVKNTFFIVLLFSFVLILLGFKTANSRKRINNELMAKTAIISEKQELLNQQNEELANLTEVQSKTLSIISHDIRGPLNSLKGILSYLEHGLVTPEEFESYIKRINAQLERNFILFDNLLKWASSQMKGVSINYERFNIVNVINDNIATYQFIADEKNITLNAETLNDGFISADKDLVSLVFRNLLSNAIKYSFENSTITIKCLAENNKVLVQVSDQGVGIPENLITEIFKLKSNSSDGTNNEKGTGLGLYFCKYAIEKNNGKLWVESKVNEGSTFYFELDTV